jgi:hypothetical protein
LFIFNLKRVHRLLEKSMKNRLNKSCLYLYEGKKFIVHSNYLLGRIYLFVFRKSSLKPYADKFFGEMCDSKLIKVKPLSEIKNS